MVLDRLGAWRALDHEGGPMTVTGIDDAGAVAFVHEMALSRLVSEDARAIAAAIERHTVRGETVRAVCELASAATFRLPASSIESARRVAGAMGLGEAVEVATRVILQETPGGDHDWRPLSLTGQHQCRDCGLVVRTITEDRDCPAGAIRAALAQRKEATR